MKKFFFITVALTMIATPALANDVTGRLGLGFVLSSAPVGGRYMFSEKVGIDLGLGLDVDESDIGGGVTESLTDWRVAVGIPVNIHQVGDRVNFNFLPLFMYENIDNGALEADDEINILLGLEFEVFVTMDFSVSAFHGVAIEMFSPGASGAETTTDIELAGGNLTEVGFHYYLPGGE